MFSRYGFATDVSCCVDDRKQSVVSSTKSKLNYLTSHILYFLTTGADVEDYQAVGSHEYIHDVS